MRYKLYLLLLFCYNLLSAQNVSLFVYKEVLNSKETFYHRLICDQSSSLYLSNRSFEKKTILKLEPPKSINDTLSDSPEKIKESLYNSNFNFNLRKLYFDEEGDALYKNIKDSIIVSRQIVNSSESLLIYEPKLPKINWVLVDSNKKIGNYICQKAIATFRGRDYEAWYTIEIPISNGP